MALRESTVKRFFTEYLDLTLPGLTGLDRTYREEGQAAAEAQFARFLRETLPEMAARYFTLPDDYCENSWSDPAESEAEVAERILRHRVMSCGEMYDFGADQPIRWTFNPTYNGYREWTWQLSRHHEWRHLAKFYRRTGEERFVDGVLDLMRSFIEQTECPENVSGYATECWRTIEIGIRLANNWPYAILACFASPRMTDHDLSVFFMSLWENVARLLTNPTSHNWLIMEMNGLIHTAVLFPFYRDAAAWREYAMSRLADELDAQFYPDHFQYEMTTGYHGCVLMNYFGVIRICRLMDVPLTDRFYRAVRDGFLMYLQLRQPDGKTPALNDGGRVTVKNEIETATEYFPNDPLFRWILTDGQEGSAPDFCSIAMPYSGLAVMRSGWGGDDCFAMLECAPFGFAHQHEDKLEVLLYAFGQELLSDSGSYAYDNSDMRKYILSSYSHNVALIDGLGQNRRDRYTWKPEDIRKKERMGWRETDAFLSATGIYDEGYGPEFLDVVHRRSLIWMKQGCGKITLPFWLVVDEFEPRDGKAHEAEILWHCPDNLPYNSDLNSVTYWYREGVSLRIIGESTPKVLIGQKTPFMCGWKPVHQTGEHEHLPTPTALFSLPCIGITKTVTALVAGGDEPSPVVSLRLNGNTLRLACPDGSEEVLSLDDYLPVNAG